MFSDEEAKKNYEDDTYTNLSRDYYTQNIKMLIDKNAHRKLNRAMQVYILSLYKDI